MVQARRRAPERGRQPASCLGAGEDGRLARRPTSVDIGTVKDDQAAELLVRLRAFVRARTADPRARIGALKALPGHAGVSYGFVLRAGGENAAAERLVIRLAPIGAPPAGPNDVVRQARIMAALGNGSGVAVPPIRWYDDDPRWFGRPFFIAGFVKGDKPALGRRTFGAVEMEHCAREAVAALARLHRLDSRMQEAFGPRIGLAGELERLDRLLDRPTLDAATVVLAPRLRKLLIGTRPTRTPTGCLHGDFNWSNCLFDGGHLAAIIDWELAQTGAVLLDIGWLCLFSDRVSWVSSDLIPANAPEPEALIEMYRDAGGPSVSDAAARWFRAFAGYRFGVITAFNLMLHRRGKRHDPMWETIAQSAPRLFERGIELLEPARGKRTAKAKPRNQPGLRR
jgi:aminoglycoside phosphotransferase (APT) family kinase protein